MNLAIELDVNHLFFWDPFLFEGTPFEMNRISFLMIVGSFMCLFFFVMASRKQERIPGRLQSMAESAYLFVRNNIAVDVIGPEGVKYAPYLFSLFFFIFFMNLMEIIPGINIPVTSRMAIPFMLAILTYVIFNVVGFAKQGMHYLTGTLFPPGVPKPIYILLTPIEFFSVFIIRPLTLAIRLLANMMAGHVLLTIFFLFTHEFLVTDLKLATAPLGVVTLIVASGLIVFEMLVISIQAYIFTMLTAFYISESIHGHGDEAHGHEDAHAEPVREYEGIEEPKATAAA
jgi:F-type H+-transporting ATPase subunit a